MTSFEICNAIRFLRPGAEFTFSNKDYSTIQWIKLEGKAPTWSELEAAHLQLKEIALQAEQEAAAKKAAAEAKLAALGLDADDLKALGLQHYLTIMSNYPDGTAQRLCEIALAEVGK